MANRLGSLPAKEQRGSRARCVLFAEGAREDVARRLTALVAPHAVVDPSRHVWAPKGLSDPAEGKLGDTAPFLSGSQREDISNWWLAVRHAAANTPNWDIISQATIGGREGLILVEAKAHDSELIKESGGKPFDEKASLDSSSNHKGIGACIDEASQSLSSASGLVWNLSRDSHYQMSNRFAWSWKVTTMGIPVVLVYLGFLNAEEMKDRGIPFENHEQWKRLVESQSQTLFPTAVWGKAWSVNGVELIPLIRSQVQSIA
ncbi:MAG: hypothetical protein H8J66_05600 [Nitrospira sp.]|nr:hypothetical protein [Nitrospira sp.]